MFVNVKKMEVEFREAIHFRIYPDEETMGGFLGQKYDLIKMYIPGNPIGQMYKTWWQATDEERQSRVQDEMKYGFSFALSRAEMEFALTETRPFIPYFADGYDLVRTFDDAIEFLRLEGNVAARAVLTMPWKAEIAGTILAELNYPSEASNTITWDEHNFENFKAWYAPRVEMRFSGSPKFPDEAVELARADAMSKPELGFAQHLEALERWAQRWSDGNLVRIEFYPDPYQSRLMSFAWGIYVYQDEEGLVEDRRFSRGDHCAINGGLIYHESSDRYQIHT